MSRHRRTFLAGCLVIGAVIAVADGRTLPARGDAAGIEAACRTSDPYLVTSVLSRVPAGVDRAAVPAVVAVRHSAGGDASARLVLATLAEVGDVYGLAYDPLRRQLYAAAYHRAGGHAGPGGAGAIYRIDLAGGGATPLVTLDAGPRAAGGESTDPDGADLVGKAGLGDLDIAEDGSELYVTNLLDRRLYRIGLPGGEVRGSVPHAAARERWAVDARPFGLGVRDGWLYYGLVNSREQTTATLPPFDAYLYRVRPGGGAHEYVFGVDLQYSRGVPWAERWGDARGDAVADAPILADIDFRADGAPILGLRDRAADMAPACVWDPSCRAGGSVGDILPARARGGGGWDVVRAPAWYRDTDPANLDLTWGALASLPGLDLVAAPARSRQGVASAFPNQVDVEWYDNGSGAPVRRAAVVAPPADGSPSAVDVGGGDIEVLCDPRTAGDPSFRGTLTAEAAVVATATAEAQAVARATALVATRIAHVPTRIARQTVVAETATVLAPTLAAEDPTATAAAANAAATAAVAIRQVTANAPTARAVATLAARAPTPAAPTATAFAAAYASIQLSCGGQNPHLATTRFVPMLDGSGQAYGRSWLEAQPVVVAFNDTATDDQTLHYPLAYQDQIGAAFGVAHDLARDHIYVGAYNKRMADFGPLGPGGIYRIELPTGVVRPVAALYAGRDPHNFANGFDVAAAPSVGRLGLGDLDVNADNTELYAVNLFDRLIYRLSIPDGQVLGVIPHGAAGQWWAPDARPFALAFHGGWLYHGVVDSRAEESVARNVPSPRPLAAYVYRSRPDGGEMREVARVDLDYGRMPAWQPWHRTHDDNNPVPQPMLVDIEFREDGDLVLGLRDRMADATVLTAGYGDMVLTMASARDPSGAVPPDRYIPLTVPEFYNDNIIHPESSWGTMASMPWLDQVVSTVIDPVTIYSGGVAWYDNVGGDIVAKETVYNGINVTFGKTAGLGDLEALCAPLTPTPSPTATSTITATATASDTPTPTGTATPTSSSTPTITLTPTPSVYRAYLPYAGLQPCVPELIYTDAVLVIDMSTSMYRPTRSGRTKHEAALEAASVFVDLLDLEPDRYGWHDRVGIAGFNDAAWTAIDLTNDRPAVHRALDGLRGRVQEGTRLDLALYEGQAVLDRTSRVGHNDPVLILLTDGLPNRVPTPAGGGSQEDTVLRAAAHAKHRGTRVFAIGLGVQDDVFDTLLRGVASAPGDYYFAPDGEDLAAIYRRIAGRLTECP